jgi:hypothetical protein
MNPRPSVIVPLSLREAHFTDITRTTLLLPTFWHEEEENKSCIRNAKTGEVTYMTMSEVSDRLTTLMYGYWEEIFGEWDDDMEDFGQRNKIRRKEAEEVKTRSIICKFWGRKKGVLKE